MKRITFEDNGQDFLFWDIDENGKIIDSQPFQASVWTKFKVLNHQNLKAGDFLSIKGKWAAPLHIIHQIEKVESI